MAGSASRLDSNTSTSTLAAALRPPALEAVRGGLAVLGGVEGSGWRVAGGGRCRWQGRSADCICQSARPGWTESICSGAALLTSSLWPGAVEHQPSRQTDLTNNIQLAGLSYQ